MSDGFFFTQEQLQVRKNQFVPLCGKCKLYQGCQSPYMPVAGKGKKEILVVGEAPGATEDANNKPFIGRAGQRFQEILRNNDCDLFEDCWVTNALICRPKDNKIPNPRMIDWCRPNVLNAIKKYKPKLIIVLGFPACKSIIGHLWKEGEVSNMERWAGWRIPCQEWNCWVCPTWHPSFILRQENEERDSPVYNLFFQQHIQKALKKTQRPWKIVPDYAKEVECILDPDVAARRIRTRAAGGLYSFDYETTTLKPDGPDAEIVCCSLSGGSTTIAYPWQGSAIEATKEFLSDPGAKKQGQNDKFEQRWTRKHLGINVQGWVWDDMLAAHALDSRREGTALKFQAFVRLGQGDYNSKVEPYLSGEGGNGKNRIWEFVHKFGMNQLLSYCGMDSLLEHKVANLQRKEMDCGQ